MMIPTYHASSHTEVAEPNRGYSYPLPDLCHLTTYLPTTYYKLTYCTLHMMENNESNNPQQRTNTRQLLCLGLLLLKHLTSIHLTSSFQRLVQLKHANSFTHSSSHTNIRRTDPNLGYYYYRYARISRAKSSFCRTFITAALESSTSLMLVRTLAKGPRLRRLLSASRYAASSAWPLSLAMTMAVLPSLAATSMSAPLCTSSSATDRWP